jgi:NAD(P)-dependent dehydrogenase (short-subunit alcohol dehydrogenase family)
MTGERVIVVAGGAAGQGLAVARRAGRGGARVVLVDGDDAPLDAACAELEALTGRRHLAHRADLDTPEGARALASWLHARVGALDALVTTPRGTGTGADPGDPERAVLGPLLGALRPCLALLGLLAHGERRRKIVLVLEPSLPGERSPALDAARAAIAALAEGLSTPLDGRGVDINCVGAELPALPLDAPPWALAGLGALEVEVAERVATLLAPESDGVTGRWLVTPTDPWQAPDFLEQLRANPERARLRRVPASRG